MSCLKNISADPQIGEYFTVVFHTCTGTYEKGELSKLRFEHIIQQSLRKKYLKWWITGQPLTFAKYLGEPMCYR
jgi:hypothetical protein